jgi:hypothetical protein
MTRDSVLASAARLADMLEPGDLDATLSQVTAAAVELIPDAAHASITVRHGDSLQTVNTTSQGVLVLDAAQYALHEGPCFEAATDAAQVTAPDLAADPRFPSYGPRAVEAGISAQAAFRLFERNGGTQGALNLYATKPGAFADLEDTAALFRSQAAVAIAYAYEITNLNEALETRTTIGQAMGIVMERYHLNDERAFAFLTRLSQHRNVKLRRVAEEIVAEAKAASDRG